jgi:hypothetical protein
MLAAISFLTSLLGTIVTIFLVNYPKEIPQYIIYRDLSFWTALIITIVILLTKYLRREYTIHVQTKLLTEQFKLSHNIVQNYKNELFGHVINYLEKSSMSFAISAVVLQMGCVLRSWHI